MKTSYELAEAISFYANSLNQCVATRLREQHDEIMRLNNQIKALRKSEASYINDDYERRAQDAYHAQNYVDASGGY